MVVHVTASADKRVAIRVGKTRITYQDIRYQEKIDSIYGNNSLPKLGVAPVLHLINNVLEKEVLRERYRLYPPDSSLDQIACTIDLRSKNTARLLQIKEIFRGNTAGYLHLYIAPVTVNQKLYAAFYADTMIHAVPRMEMLKLHDNIFARPDDFERLPHFQTVSISKNIMPNGTFKVLSEEPASKPLFEKILTQLKPGGIWTEIIEDQRSYMMIKLESEDDSVYHCGVIAIAKMSFDQWFHRYVLDNIPITFYDRQLLKEIGRMYPEAWWLTEKKRKKNSWE